MCVVLLLYMDYVYSQWLDIGIRMMRAHKDLVAKYNKNIAGVEYNDGVSRRTFRDDYDSDEYIQSKKEEEDYQLKPSVKKVKNVKTLQRKDTESKARDFYLDDWDDANVEMKKRLDRYLKDNNHATMLKSSGPQPPPDTEAEALTRTIEAEKQDELDSSVKNIAPREITPRNYDAIQIHGHFGLIDVGTGPYKERVLIVHTPKNLDKSHMLSLREGDPINLVYIKRMAKGAVRIRYITRERYFAPGNPVTSIKIGVDDWG